MADAAKSGAHLVASYVMSLAMFALAAALVYFAYEVSRVSTQIPDILDSVDHTSDKVGPIIHEVGEIRDMVPDILHEVEETRKLVPPILAEIEQTRLSIPPILEEVAQTREQIPPILNEVEAVRKELPAVLESADKASNAVVVVSKEIQETRPLIPQVLKEVETTRESIPPMLDRADAMIDKARLAGQEASTGAVTGFFKGLVTAPFTLVGDAGRNIAGMSDEEMKQLAKKDFDLIETAALYLLNNGVMGEGKEISNPDSGFSATLKLVDESTTEEDFVTLQCRTVFYDGYINGERIKTLNRTFCKQEGGGWDLDE
ncbi:MAG: hypothetical protein KJP10_09925 [Gammaproteobacteria bacterium]|nr:hypothetical protein [Gammaproteobacteria bacterium]